MGFTPGRMTLTVTSLVTLAFRFVSLLQHPRSIEFLFWREKRNVTICWWLPNRVTITELILDPLALGNRERERDDTGLLVVGAVMSSYLVFWNNVHLSERARWGAHQHRTVASCSSQIPICLIGLKAMELDSSIFFPFLKKSFFFGSHSPCYI